MAKTRNKSIHRTVSSWAMEATVEITLQHLKDMYDALSREDQLFVSGSSLGVEVENLADEQKLPELKRLFALPLTELQQLGK